MTKDQENVNLLMKNNVLRNEGDSYPRKFVFLFEAKDLKELTKKVASIEISGGTTHFQSQLCCLLQLTSELLAADGKQNNPWWSAWDLNLSVSATIKQREVSLIQECNLFFTKIHQTCAKQVCRKQVFYSKSDILRLLYFLKMFTGQWGCKELQANIQEERD